MSGGYWPEAATESSSTVKDRVKPGHLQDLADRGARRGELELAAPLAGAPERGEQDVIPVESQNTTPDMSTITRAGRSSASTSTSSRCSRGAV